MLALQWIVAGVLVLASVLYSTWRLLPAGRRLALLSLLIPPAERLHLGWPRRARARLLAGAAGGCAGCAASAPAPPTRTTAAPRR